MFTRADYCGVEHMKTHEADLFRHHLDLRIAPLRKVALEAPSGGWVRAVRQSLGMTMRQLGARMGVSPSRIARIEHDELTGATTLKVLRQAAVAMNCTLVHALVPTASLTQIVVERTAQKARLRSVLYGGSPSEWEFHSLRGLWDD